MRIYDEGYVDQEYVRIYVEFWKDWSYGHSTTPHKKDQTIHNVAAATSVIINDCSIDVSNFYQMISIDFFIATNRLQACRINHNYTRCL